MRERGSSPAVVDRVGDLIPGDAALTQSAQVKGRPH
jgi:hypothetical protein